jgi:hypothetical protein
MFDNWSARPVRWLQIGSKRMKRSAKKDFLMRAKICRKEAKECRLFLRLIDTGSAKGSVGDRDALIAEARELVLIFSSIISKASNDNLLFFDFGILTLLGIWGLGFGTS